MTIYDAEGRVIGDPPVPEPELVAPKAIVTLKVADEADRELWVTETVDQVRERIRNHARGRDPLLQLMRIKGMRPEPFYTRFDNVANVKEAS